MQSVRVVYNWTSIGINGPGIKSVINSLINRLVLNIGKVLIERVGIGCDVTIKKKN